ncbi:hypothetical protein [Streptomyces griseoruber]|uniref:Uncharacterized protein n=1 Tax=Streptomyces griseoruber TaxID=1943 RepID=A0A117REG8_9ACTN|nr:hypothetical protein [Streptomyces griseoruber]KUN86291.1 hypothetical protein AQJ64_09685 [Streptomyces griseoruber]
MGMYLVSVTPEDWSVPGEDGYGDVASALAERLAWRGLPPYRPGRPPEPGRFAEKTSPPMDGFDALCRARLTPEERHTLLGWSFLVPCTLEEPVLLPLENTHDTETLVVGAPCVLALAERLAAALRLPLDLVPEPSGPHALGAWFLDGDAEKAAATRPGPWADGLDTAFFTALYLRAAQYALRHRCPMTYS